MTDTKFTKGPWRAVKMDYSSCTYYVNGGKYGAVAHIPPSKVKDVQANANLIAAAPELYQTLVECRERFSKVEIANQWELRMTSIIDTVLKKARGEL